MTEVHVSKKKNDVVKVKVTGHAFYAEYGKDIVCSAISMISYTIGNKLLSIEENNVNINIDEGFFEINIKNSTHDNQLLLETLTMGFFMIQEQYEDKIKIKEVDYV